MTLRAVITLCLVVAAAPLAIAEDEIGKKLADAKAAYQTNMERARGAARAWFDKREDAARKDGDRKLVEQIKAERAKYDGGGEFPKSAPSELAKSFTDAHKAMEDAYITAVKEYTRARQDELAAAVDKDLETFKRGGAGAAENPLGIEITADILKAKFAGKAKFDDKTGQLELTYKFADKDDLKDFELSDVQPRVANNGVALAAGQKITHVVQYDVVTVAGVIQLRQMKGTILTTTGGTVLALGGSGNDAMFLMTKGNPKAMDKIVATRYRKGTFRFGVEITEKRATMYYANEQLGAESPAGAAGQIVLQGGEQGYSFGTMVISGKPNKQWAQKFFAATPTK